MDKKDEDFKKLCDHIFDFASEHGTSLMYSCLSSVLMKFVTEQNRGNDNKEIDMVMEGRGIIKFTIDEAQKLPEGMYKKC